MFSYEMQHVSFLFIRFPLHLSLAVVTAAAVNNNWGCVIPLSRLNASTLGWLSSINWLRELQERKNVCVSMFPCVLCVCVHGFNSFVCHNIGIRALNLIFMSSSCCLSNAKWCHRWHPVKLMTQRRAIKEGLAGSCVLSKSIQTYMPFYYTDMKSFVLKSNIFHLWSCLGTV